jgi:hypothetical protein
MLFPVTVPQEEEEEEEEEGSCKICGFAPRFRSAISE